MATAPPPVSASPPKSSAPSSRPATPPTAPPPAGPPSTNGPKKQFSVRSGVAVGGQRVVVYGPGGVGKSELCSLLSDVGINPLFLDIEDGTKFLNIDRCEPSPGSFEELRQVLQADQIWEGFNAVVIDSLTKAEELAVQWTLQNVQNDKGNYVKSVEGYGFGKGFTHVYESFLPLLGDLDSHIRKGRHVVCIAHDCTTNVPNPSGEDWIRYEPRLQSPTSGKASIRHRVKEWCDHMLFIGFDLAVSKDGKATGSGTRTIYPTEYPAWWAKSRSLADPIPYEQNNPEIWRQIFQK